MANNSNAGDRGKISVLPSVKQKNLVRNGKRRRFCNSGPGPWTLSFQGIVFPRDQILGLNFSVDLISGLMKSST